jgi:hypothetical protein
MMTQPNDPQSQLSCAKGVRFVPTERALNLARFFGLRSVCNVQLVYVRQYGWIRRCIFCTIELHQD